MTTVRVIGSKGNMGREHVAAYKQCGVRIVDIGKSDIVSIASPDHTHGEYVIEALKNGSHVFCEKPICRKDWERTEILGLSRNLYVRQNFPLRYQPIFVTMKDNIPSFGEIYRVEASYNWGRTHKLTETWRKEDSDYSLVFGGMIHMIDLVVWLTRQQLDVISVAFCNKSAPEFPGPDTVTALCEMEGGGICTLTVDGGLGVDRHHHRLTIHGNRRGWTVANHAPTDKRAAIYDFVNCVEKGKGTYIDPCGMHAISVCMDIEGHIADRRAA